MRNTAKKTRRRDELGQALLELTLALPIFVLILTGAVEMGRLAYTAVEVSNAARAGVQYGAQNHATAADNFGMQQAALNDAPDVHGLTAAASTFCVCSNLQTTRVACNTNCSPNRLIQYVQVSTSANVNPLFHYPGLAQTFTYKGLAMMRVEQ